MNNLLKTKNWERNSFPRTTSSSWSRSENVGYINILSFLQFLFKMKVLYLQPDWIFWTYCIEARLTIFPALFFAFQITLRACFGAWIPTLHPAQVGWTGKSKFVTTRQIYVFFKRTSATFFVTVFRTWMTFLTAFVEFPTLFSALNLKQTIKT